MNFDKFTGKAKAYAAARPSYPAEAVEYIMSLVPKNSVFADIGAGTGRFSELIAKKGNTLYAVEPNPDMREQLYISLGHFPNASIVDGNSSDTTLASQTIDVITSAQALHWFNLEKYMVECSRIGKSSYWIIIIYNDHSEPSKKSHREIAVESFLTAPEVKHFRNDLVYTRERWLTFMTSHSSDPSPDSDGYEAHMIRMNDLFDASQKDGLMHVEETTKVFSQRYSN